jgi:uncharacterized protein YdhG (YjbR/CyaY superfamily)
MPPTRSIDEYIESFPPDVQSKLREMQELIRGVLPGAEETISYGIPTFRLDGTNVLHFAGFKQHLGLYPIVDADEALEQQVAPFRAGKGTLRFALDVPLPRELIVTIVTLLRDRAQQRTGR